MGRVILLAGPVGAGKTTVSTELARHWVGPLCVIEGDRFWTFIHNPASGDRRETFRVVMRSLCAAAIPFARSGHDVIVDFSFPSMFIRTAQRILKDIELHYVLIRPPLEICAARAAGRAEGRIDDYQSYRDFYGLFDDGPDESVIDEAEGAASQVAELVAAGLRADRFRIAPAEPKPREPRQPNVRRTRPKMG